MCLAELCDKLLVCMTSWMTATLGLNAVWKLYIRDKHIVNSIKDSMDILV
jgi:hypothetical protein